MQLFNADGVKLRRDDRSCRWRLRLGARLGNQSNMSIVVQPGPYTDYIGSDTQRCQYRWTEHGGISFTAGEDKNLGVVGLSRKDGGICRAPVGDPVGH